MLVTTDTDIRLLAFEFLQMDLCPMPPKQDGSKRPHPGDWRTYQHRLPTRRELDSWYSEGLTGIGAVCGAISGGLELFEFDDMETYLAFCEVAEQAGLGELVSRVRLAYSERTPGNGIHWFYRCEEIAGNTKLATVSAPTDANPRGVKVLIETRGEGGYAVMAPSFGAVHPSGLAYEVLSGNPGDIITITPEERASLWALARTFGKEPEQPAPVSAAQPRSGDADARPGDVFNDSATWGQVLEPCGWRRVYSRAGTTYWRRPGKTEGVSATTNHTGNDTLIVFSTSTPFDIAPASYSKFAAYAVLHHGGDYAAAGRALLAEGYGETGSPSPSISIDWRTQPTEVDPDTGEVREPRLLIWSHELDALPDVEWLIDGVMPVESLGMIFGKQRSAKTFVMLDMACCVSLGLPWKGFDTRQGKVVYVYAEGIRGLRRRVRAWEAFHGHRVTGVAFVPRAIHMLRSDDVAFLIERVKAEMGDTPALVIIDTLARAMAGGDENQQKDMGIFVDAADRLRRELHCTVWFVHHENMAGGNRGSTALPGAVDTQLRATRAEQKGLQDRLTISFEKQKDGEEYDDLKLRLTPVDDSLVVEMFDARAHGAISDPNEKSVLRALAEAHPETLANSDLQTKLGLGHTKIYQLVKALLGAGEVYQTGFGRAIRYGLTTPPESSADATESSADETGIVREIIRGGGAYRHPADDFRPADANEKRRYSVDPDFDND